MKATISVMSLLFLCLISVLFSVQSERYGTSVISAKSKIKGGNYQFNVKLPDGLNRQQLDNLNLAYKIAKEDGHKNPEILQGVLLQETKAGGMQKYKVAGQEFGGSARYFGIAQVKLNAAIDVLKKYPELWRFMQTREPEEIIANLILNNEFNIRIASKYLLMVGENTSTKHAITAYNKGVGGAKTVDANNHNYTIKVSQYMNSPLLKKINNVY